MEAIAIDIPSVADGPAGGAKSLVVVGIAAGIIVGIAIHGEAEVISGDCGELYDGGETTGFAKDDVAFTVILRAVSGAVTIRIRRTDDEIGKAIAIDVTGAADGEAGAVVCADAVDDEAGGAVEIGEEEFGG